MTDTKTALSDEELALSGEAALSGKNIALSDEAVLSEKTAQKLINQQLLQQLTLAQQVQDDEIDLGELWRAILSGKWLVVAITSVFAIASVAYALYLPNIYKSEALLAPATQEESDGMGGLASKFGGLASLAGVNLGGGSSVDNTALAIEILKSRKFISRFIMQHQLLVPLMAATGWNRDSNELVIDPEIYDQQSKKWVREVKAPFKAKPSTQEAYKAFKKIFSVSQDEETSMITMSASYYSPEMAKQWVDWLIDMINEEMKTRDLTDAHNSIDYLEQQLSTTKFSELKTVLFQIIEQQTKTIMFAEVREQYAFKTVDPAVVPELKAEPKRALICVLGTMLGGMLGVAFVLIRFATRKKDDEEVAQ